MVWATAVLPAMVCLGLYYSLAVHMWWRFGAWPTAIGDRGFPRELVIHSDWASVVFGVLFAGVFLLPIPALAFLTAPRLQRVGLWLGIYVASMTVCRVMMLIAPQGFVRWWMD